MLRGRRFPSDAIARALACSASASRRARLRFGAAAAPVPSADPATLRHLPAGDVVGRAGQHGGHAWLGLPYAEPPLGELRWRAPQPLAAVDRHARGARLRRLAARSSRAPSAATTPPRRGTLVGSEDCLYLNVYAPAFAPDAVPTGERAAARDGLDPRRRQHRSAPRATTTAAARDRRTTADRGDDQLPARRARLVPARGAARGPRRRPRPRATSARSTRSRALAWVRDNAAALRRRPGQRHDLRRVGGRPERARAARLAARARPVPARHRRRAAAPGAARPPRPSTARRRRAGRRAELRGDAARACSSARAEPRTAPRQAALAAMPPAELAAFLRGRPARAPVRGLHRGGSATATTRRACSATARVLPAEPLPRGARRARARTTRCRCCSAATATSRSCSPSSTRSRCGAGSALSRARRTRSPTSATPPTARAPGRSPASTTPRARCAGAQPGRVFAYRFDWDEEPTVLGADLGELLGAAHGLEIPLRVRPLGARPAPAASCSTPRTSRAARRSPRMMMSYWAEFAARGDPGRGRDGSLPRWARVAGRRREVRGARHAGGRRRAHGRRERAARRHRGRDPRRPELRGRGRALPRARPPGATWATRYAPPTVSRTRAPGEGRCAETAGLVATRSTSTGG